MICKIGGSLLVIKNLTNTQKAKFRYKRVPWCTHPEKTTCVFMGVGHVFFVVELGYKGRRLQRR